MRVFFFSPSNVCFCREKEEKKNHAVPIYLSRTDKNRPFQYGCCPAKAVSNLLQSLVEGGGLFWQDQIWQTSRKRGRPSRFTSYSSSSKKLIFPPSGVFFFFGCGCCCWTEEIRSVLGITPGRPLRHFGSVSEFLPSRQRNTEALPLCGFPL